MRLPIAVDKVEPPILRYFHAILLDHLHDLPFLADYLIFDLRKSLDFIVF